MAAQYQSVQHPVVRWMAATLDGVIEGSEAVFEAKFMLPTLLGRRHTREHAGHGCAVELPLRQWLCSNFPNLARNLRSSLTISPMTARQSPGVGWRNSRIVGYQGESVRSRSQRQSGTCSRASHTGRPIDPARWAG